MEKIVLDIGGKIKELRSQNNLSIKRLADKSGVSAAGIYKIENNQMTPSVTTLLKLAKALDKKIGFFVGEYERVRDVEFIKKGGREKLRSTQSRFLIESIAARLEDCKMAAGIVTIERGGGMGDEPVSHPGEELVLCLEGEVEFTVGDKKFTLTAGDSLHYKTHLPHFWRNRKKKKARLFYVMTPPPFSAEISVIPFI